LEKEKKKKMATSNNTPPLIYLDKKWDPPKPVKAGVETFIICPTITRSGSEKVDSAIHFEDGGDDDGGDDRNLFTMNYTFVEKKLKVLLGGLNIPKSWGNGDAFTNVKAFNMINPYETTLENFMETFQYLPRGTPTNVPGTTLKIAKGAHAGLKLYEEGLITFDMIRSISSDHDTIIPYDTENNMIGQFLDLSVLGDDYPQMLNDAGKWEDSFCQKMGHSLIFLRTLKTKLDEVTDLAKKEAASINTAVPYNVASLYPRNSSNGSAKRKR